MCDMRQSVIIVAGGKGLRMGKEIPKQFIPIGGFPVLMWTIRRFYEFDSRIQIILVLPEDQQSYWEELCKKYDFNIAHAITSGGETRFHSVQNGLRLMQSADLVGVHDGVRPFVSLSTIDKCYRAAAQYGAAIPVLPSVESIRKVNYDGSSESCMRNDYRMVQTPQVFKTEWLLNSYSSPWQDDFTDDASVVEAAGYPITLAEGNPENIKITSPFDLLIGEVVLNSLASQPTEKDL